MASLPNKLKLFELYVNGRAIGKKAKNVTLPKLTRKMEEWRAGSMTGAVSVDLGMEAMSLEFTTGGAEIELIKQFGSKTVDGVQLRFAGAYQCDDTAAINAVEIVVRGRFSDIDFGVQEAGTLGETKVIMPCAYLKYIFNGQTIVEIDPLNAIEIVNGTDLLDEVRAALGMSSLGSALF